MASEEKIRARIAEIAGRPKNVTLSEIDWVMTQLDKFGELLVDGNEHLKLYSFDGAMFSVCTHHRGQKQLKPVYVKNFLKAMIKTGWYE